MQFAKTSATLHDLRENGIIDSFSWEGAFLVIKMDGENHRLSETSYPRFLNAATLWLRTWSEMQCPQLRAA